MSIPIKEFIISELQKKLSIELKQLPGKRIFYTGKLHDCRNVLVCTPQSKLHPKGNGWIDITLMQVSLLEEAECPILALRIEGSKVYYLNFKDIKPFLTTETMINNKKEGEHWKLHIWPDHIQVLGNRKNLLTKANNLKELME